MNKELLVSFKEETQEMLALLEEYLIDIEKDPLNSEVINGIFRIMHTIKGTASLMGIEDISSFAHELENIFDDIREGKYQINENIISQTLKSLDLILDFLDDKAEDFDSRKQKILKNILRSSENCGRSLFFLKLALSQKLSINEIKDAFEVERHYPDESDIPFLKDFDSKNTALFFNIFLWSEDEKQIKEYLNTRSVRKYTLEKILSHSTQIGKSPVKHFEKNNSDNTPKNRMDLDTIRIKADRIDKIVDMTGELVIAQARLAEFSRKYNDTRLGTLSRDFEMLINSLRENAMSFRMVQVNTLFKRFKRVVRELSKELDKDIELHISGADTELDRSVIEKLYDPILHIIRNSCDHGIKKSGVIKLEAIHEAADVVIRISDNGIGIDREEVIKKAYDKGIISKDTELSDKEVLDLIMLPGFSTAKNITNVSGRGVGMDVVANSIKELRGSMSIDSEKGKGTKISIFIPLTVAIIEGFLVRVGSSFFIIPLSVVESCIKLENDSTEKSEDWIIFREKVLPYANLSNFFNIEEKVHSSNNGIVVVVREEGSFFGIKVDEVFGIRNTVIKPLGELNHTSPEISGAAILGDGTIALIIDTKLLFSKLVE